MDESKQMNGMHWLPDFIHSLTFVTEDSTAEQIAQRISKALEIAEVRKYATPESRFTFELADATEDDVATIRKHLSPFENSIVEITIR